MYDDSVDIREEIAYTPYMQRTTVAIPPETSQQIRTTLTALDGKAPIWGRRFGGRLTVSDVTREALARGLRSIDLYPEVDPALVAGLVSETRNGVKVSE